MINLIKYIYKFLYHSSLNKYNFISFFPLLSISAGTIIIFFTISIMEGMEEALFQKMESFHFTYSGDLNDEFFLENLVEENVRISTFDIYNGSSNWEKDDENIKLKDALKKVSHVQQKNLAKWTYMNWEQL